MVRISVKTACERDELLGHINALPGEIEQAHVRFVHVGSSDCPRLVSLVHERHHLLVAAHDKFAQVLNIWPQTGMFSHAKVSRVLWIEEVADLFVVDLSRLLATRYQAGGPGETGGHRPRYTTLRR